METKTKEEIKEILNKIKGITETFINEELSPRFSQFSKIGFLKSIEHELASITEKLGGEKDVPLQPKE